jgi:glycosyltransferase involved in cell wall biosynthesis
VRLAIFMSHPIQYQVSLLKHISMSDGIDLEVYFYWDFGYKDTYDQEFDSKIKWDLPLLDGYKNRFLKNFSIKKGTHFFGCINPSVIFPVLFKKHEVVMIFGWALFSNWLVFLAAILSRTPILLFAESPLSHELIKSGFFNKFRQKLLKVLFNLIDGFIYIGEENKEFYESYNIPESKLYYAPYAVDNTRHQRSKNEIEISGIRSDISIEKVTNSVVILFVGKLIEKKRPMDLLKSFKKLQDDSSNKKILLWFVGDGEQRIELKEYVEQYQINDVKFWGFQNQTELPHLYALGDIFVLPSGYGETWGLVVNEAMCYAKPIVVSDLVGCGKDLVTPNNGFIVPYSDNEKMANAIKLLVENDQLRKDFGKESERIIKNFSQEICAKKISIAVSSILNQYEKK